MSSKLILVLLCLLAKPEVGFGWQEAASNFDALVADAQRNQVAHNYAAAANAYKQALRFEPNMAELWANLGLMEQEAGDISQAIPDFQHANRLNPSLYVPNLFLGIDYVRTRKAKEAIPFLTKAEHSNATDPEPRLALGRAYTALGEYSSAAHAYQHAIDLNPKQSSAWFALGIAHLDQMETASRRMASEDQNSSYAKALFAESLEKQSRYVEAAKIYKSLIDKTSEPPCLRSELGWLLLKQRDIDGAAAAFEADHEANPQCALSLLGQARIAIEKVNDGESLTLLKALWERDPGFVRSNQATFTEGLSADRISGYKTALAQQEQTIPADLYKLLSAATGASSAEVTTPVIAYHSTQLPPTAASLNTGGTAESYFRSGEFQRCSDRLQPFRSTAQPDKLLLLATCSFFTGDYERSADASAALLGLAPHSTAALYWSIKANEKLAFQALAAFEQLEPNAARSHILLGDILRQRREYSDAVAEYKKAQEIDPADTAAMIGMASAYLSNGDTGKTVEVARVALLHDADDAELNLILAEGLVAQHDYVEAEPYLMKSLKAKPQMLPHVHALLGRVYAEAGKTQQAIAQLKMGAESDDDGSVHYQLARLYRQTGDSKSASAALEQMKLIQKREHEREMMAFQAPEPASSDNVPQ